MNDGTSWTWVELYEHCKFNFLFRKVYFYIEAFRDDGFGFQKKSNGASRPGDKLTTLPVQGTSEISTVKERSCHIANEHFKITR